VWSQAGNPALTATKSELVPGLQSLLCFKEYKGHYLPEKRGNPEDKNVCNAKILTGRRKVKVGWSTDTKYNDKNRRKFSTDTYFWNTHIHEKCS